VLRFLVPILNPNRPIQVTITLGSTLFGALSGERKIDWDLIVHDLVAKMSGTVGRTKPVGTNSFLFHLYHSLDLLKNTERATYTKAEVMLQYRIKP